MIRTYAMLWFTMLPVSAGPAITWTKLPPLPNARGIAAPFAGVTGAALLVAGGANFPDRMPWAGGRKVWHDTVWLLEMPGGNWREVAKLQRPLAYGVSVSTADGVVCAGGSDSTRHYADAFRLVWRGGTLVNEPLPPLPITLSGGCGALVKNTLYVACGAEQPGEQAATNRAFALDLAAQKNAWREIPALPGKPRLLATAASWDGAFFVLGGAALEAEPGGKMTRQYLRETWRYRPDRGWQRLADLPKPNVAAPSPAPVIGGRILLLAGDDGSRAGFTPPQDHPGFPGTILAYDAAMNRWTEAGETPAPRATVPCVKWQESFVIPSGEVRPGVRSPDVWTMSLSRER
jgi:N-acetylneuraminate epimerase